MYQDNRKSVGVRERDRERRRERAHWALLYLSKDATLPSLHLLLWPPGLQGPARLEQRQHFQHKSLNPNVHIYFFSLQLSFFPPSFSPYHSRSPNPRGKAWIWRRQPKKHMQTLLPWNVARVVSAKLFIYIWISEFWHYCLLWHSQPFFCYYLHCQYDTCSEQILKSSIVMLYIFGASGGVFEVLQVIILYREWISLAVTYRKIFTVFLLSFFCWFLIWCDEAGLSAPTVHQFKAGVQQHKGLICLREVLLASVALQMSAKRMCCVNTESTRFLREAKPECNSRRLQTALFFTGKHVSLCSCWQWLTSFWNQLFRPPRRITCVHTLHACTLTHQRINAWGHARRLFFPCWQTHTCAVFTQQSLHAAWRGESVGRSWQVISLCSESLGSERLGPANPASPLTTQCPRVALRGTPVPFNNLLHWNPSPPVTPPPTPPPFFPETRHHLTTHRKSSKYNFLHSAAAVTH